MATSREVLNQRLDTLEKTLKKICQTEKGSQVLAAMVATGGVIPTDAPSKLKKDLDLIALSFDDKDPNIKKITRMAVNLELIYGANLYDKSKKLSKVLVEENKSRLLGRDLANRLDSIIRDDRSLNPYYHTLNIDDLDDIQFQALCAVTKDLMLSNPNPTKVNEFFNQIIFRSLSCNRMPAMFAAMKESGLITSLDLYNRSCLSKLEDSNVQALCDIIKNSNTLTSLDFTNSGLIYNPTKNLIKLFHAIRDSSVTILTLPSNNLVSLHDDTFQALCEAIRYSKITFLDLSFNRLEALSPDRFNSLSEAIKQNTSLVKVKVDMVEIIEAIKPSIEKHKELQKDTGTAGNRKRANAFSFFKSDNSHTRADNKGKDKEKEVKKEVESGVPSLVKRSDSSNSSE